jgi:hypothetical protein
MSLVDWGYFEIKTSSTQHTLYSLDYFSLYAIFTEFYIRLNAVPFKLTQDEKEPHYSELEIAIKL